MNEIYKLNVLGCKRDLVIATTPSGIKIAGFNPVGDLELLKVCAKNLVKQLKKQLIKCDLILTTEFKGLPIAQEVARRLKKDYICLRKESKCYMGNTTPLKSKSITSGESCYYISQIEKDKINDKHVVFIDDVFSTGSTFDAIINFSSQINFNLNACAVILKEDFIDWNKNNKSPFVYKNIPCFYCGFLPLQK